MADVPVEWPCRSSVAAVEVTAAIPQLQLVVLVLGQGRSHARCVQRHLFGGSEFVVVVFVLVTIENVCMITSPHACT